MLTFNVCLVGGLLVAAGGLAYGYGKYSQLARVELGGVLTERSGSDDPQNFLLVGVDTAGALDPDDPALTGRAGIGGLRSDTMLVLRVEPGAGQAALLSLPRDLWVPMASGGRQRLNAAIEIGGPGELIDTIEQYLGIPINHYVQVDFAGFKGLVEAVDGVPVYFPTPVRDRGSFLDIEEGGCITLDGDQALAYVRARGFQTFEDGRWRTDPSGDLGRQSRQQDFIVRALRRSIDKGIRNPVTLDRLVDAGLATVTVDDVLTADDILALASGLRSFDPGDLVLNQLPVRDDSIGAAQVLRLLDGPAQPILDAFRESADGALSPATVRVQVLNGSGVAGQAGQTAAELAARGFASAGTGEAARFDTVETVVRHAPGQRAAAELVARWLVGPVSIEEALEPLAADVVVVTGRDFAGVRSSPGPAPPPSSEAPASGPSTTTVVAPTTSTTLVGEVPRPPEGVDC